MSLTEINHSPRLDVIKTQLLGSGQGQETFGFKQVTTSVWMFLTLEEMVPV
jgi:hypothetical protein